MKMIDLRSDTVTKPSEKMRQAMFNAEVGDSIYKEDPTVNKLQEMAAEITGKESAVFVPSGTMGNLASVLTHCPRGTEVILGNESHIFYYEAGGISALGGIHPHTLPNNYDGTIALKDIEQAIRPDDIHFPRTSLICLENTHNRCGGSVLNKDYMEGVKKIADKYNLKVHLDGSRIFNASEALGVEPAELTKDVSSVNICLSKGLSAPVGSLICGEREFIKETERTVKMLGGAMRQAGVLAACGIVALNEMRTRLTEDRLMAEQLEDKLAEIEGLNIIPVNIRTNILYFEIKSFYNKENVFVSNCKKNGLLLNSIGSGKFRVVTHRCVFNEEINKVPGIIRNSLLH